jgi:hypothetical protein
VIRARLLLIGSLARIESKSSVQSTASA